MTVREKVIQLADMMEGANQGVQMSPVELLNILLIGLVTWEVLHG